MLRRQLQHLAENFAELIQTANTVTIGRRGIELKGQINLVSADVQARKIEFRRFITGLTDRGDLDAIADTLNLAKSTNIRSQRTGILGEIARLVKTKQDTDELSARLKIITKQDF